MLPLLRLLMFVPLLFAARVRGIERRTIARLEDAGADMPERAILLEEGGKVSAWVYRRLQRAGALQSVSNDRYYLSRAGYEGFRGRRRRRALSILTVLLVAIAVAFLFGVIR